LRAGRSGSTVNAAGERRVSGLLRVQGRLKFDGKSPIDLEHPHTLLAA